MPLVRSVTEAALNAQEFNRLQIGQNKYALRYFSTFSHWYYFSHLDLFAPSKFIGYRGTNIESYNGDGYGDKTQTALLQWFRKVDPNSEQFQILKARLEAYAKSLGKSISRRTFEGSGGIYLLAEEYATGDYPDEVSINTFIEGGTKEVLVNAYERNAQARAACVAHWGAVCYVCKLEFTKMYGEALGAGFIHVHHLRDLASIGSEYVVNPINDLLPLCPNCHAMVHKQKPAMHPDELRERIRLNITISPVRQEILQVLAELSEVCPEVRLGQLIANLSYLARGLSNESIWDMEDKELLEAARKHLEQWRDHRETVA